MHLSPNTAAGIPPIITLVIPGGRIGPPVWGLPFRLVIGQLWLSVILAAAGIILIVLVDEYLSAFNGYIT